MLRFVLLAADLLVILVVEYLKPKLALIIVLLDDAMCPIGGIDRIICRAEEGYLRLSATLVILEADRCT